FEKGYTVAQIEELTKIDRWFLEKLENIYNYSKVLATYSRVEELPKEVLLEAKRLGFSDFQIARFVEEPAGTVENELIRVRDHRKKMGIIPIVRRINTVASDHPDKTNYLYFTYGSDKAYIPHKEEKEAVIVLGSGAYRIGSSVEFDW
ncbi:MAG TPA: carbamoyl phosphate synthase large subunit, partial [Porphyromonadaceae bacterium]|nr:carbamoyl phosphate synthase large subunit [Porphyromonadaceae bacterium]